MSSLYPFFPVQRTNGKEPTRLAARIQTAFPKKPDVAINTSTSRLAVAIYNV